MTTIWVTPAARSTGDLVTAAIWNQDVVAHTKLLRSPAACRAYQSTDGTFSSSAYAAVTFDTEDFDNAAMHSTASNTDQFTAPVDGLYGVWLVTRSQFTATLKLNVNGTNTWGEVVRGPDVVFEMLSLSAGDVVSWSLKLDANGTVYFRSGGLVFLSGGETV